MRHPRLAFGSLAVLAALAAGSVRAEGLARFFPEETLLYVAADDVGRALETFKETGLGRVWYDAEMQAFLEPSLVWFAEAIAKLRDETGFDVNDLKAGLSRRAAVGLWTDFAEDAAVVVVLQPPDEEAGRRIVETLPGLLRKTSPGWHWDEAALDPAGVSCVTFDDGAFSFASREGFVFAAFAADGRVLEEVVWDEGRPRLPDNPVFTDTLSKMEGARDIVMFTNLDALWRGLAPAAQDDENLSKAMLVFDSLGFTETRSAAFGLAADPPGFRSRLFVRAPTPPKGIYSLIREEPLGDALLGAVPADVQYVWAGRLDLSMLPQVVRDALRKAGVPPVAVDVAMGVAIATIGFNPETDILKSLGDEMAVALITPDAVGGLPIGLNGLCLIAKVKDRATFGRALVKLIGLGARYAGESAVGGGEIKLKHRGRSIRGVEVAGAVAPSCTLTDEYFVFALYPSAVKLVIDTIEGRSPSVLETPSFEEAFSRLDRGRAVAIAYGVRPQIGSAGGASAVGSAGVLAGLLLPALSSARERARRVKCMNNLKQIGYALHLFSADNAERFPESLDELTPDYIPDERIFACPSGDGGYVYVSGLSAASDPRSVMAFDREGNHSEDGLNVLFVGGNVEWTSHERFQEALAGTRQRALVAGKEIGLVDGPAVADGAPGGAGVARDKGEEAIRFLTRMFPFYRLPPLRLVNRNLFPTGAVTRWTENGLLSEDFGPLPLSVGPAGMSGVATASVIAAIAIPNLVASRVASNETAAVAALMTYLSAQNQFHRTDFYGVGRLTYANPKDGKGYPDLYQIGGPGSGGLELKLIDKALARASSPASPRAGYRFVDITRDSWGEEYDYTIDCGLCAVPVEHDRSGRNTFIVDVTGVVYQKDTGGEPVTEYPDVAGEGWVPVGAE